jgi:hypothetical protein
MIRLTAEPGHRLARPGAVEFPAVVVAPDVLADHTACGERCVAMCAAIQQHDALSVRVAKCNER